MRMSCNGCRVLRKGCSENCSIRPCLQWIKTSESQSNATLFLAKFYGRAGLLNLINAGPEHLRPSIFQSMLYEACGRIVNPIYGSVGLLWSGNWKLCQSAVESVLNGDPIKDISSSQISTTGNPNPPPPPPPPHPHPPFNAASNYDIRHVFKDENDKFQQLHKVKTRNRFKRTASKPNSKPDSSSKSMIGGGSDRKKKKKKLIDSESVVAAEACNLRSWKIKAEPSHDSSLSHHHQQEETEADQESMVSVETVEGSVVNRIEMERVPGSVDDEGLLNLNLTLGF